MKRNRSAMTSNAHDTPVTLPRYIQCATTKPLESPAPTLRQRALSALQRVRSVIRGLRGPAPEAAPPLQWQIDWDNDVPPLPILTGDVARARASGGTPAKSSKPLAKPLPDYAGS